MRYNEPTPQDFFHGNRKAYPDALHHIGVPLLRNLKSSELEKIADTLQELHFASGVDIIKQGEVGDAMYILKSGACEAAVEGVSEPVMRYTKSGDFFGELALCVSPASHEHTSGTLLHQRLFSHVFAD